MPESRSLHPASPWVELVVTDADWDAADPDLLRTVYAQLVWIRSFEQVVLDLAGAGLIHGPAHSSIGQEGGAVGSVLALTSDDTVNGSHRGHHQFLAKALHHVEPKGLDPLAAPGDGVREVLLRTLAEICGLDRGWSHGRGRLHAPAVARGRCDGHQRDRRRRRPAGRRLRVVAPPGRHATRCRSPTSATAPSTSAPPSRR